MGNKLPAGVWSMGFVSLLMDFSSEMIHSLLPLFLVGTLGASVALAGLIEGLAEALALVSRVLSGVIADRLGRRKGLAVFVLALALGVPMAWAPMAMVVMSAVYAASAYPFGRSWPVGCRR